MSTTITTHPNGPRQSGIANLRTGQPVNVGGATTAAGGSGGGGGGDGTGVLVTVTVAVPVPFIPSSMGEACGIRPKFSR